MANIKEEVDTTTNGIPVPEEAKTDDATNPNIFEGLAPEEDKKKCSCGETNCESCTVKFEATNNFNKDFGNNSYCQSVSNKELRKCNRCGEVFHPASAYRKHYMKCWRSFRKKVALVRGNKTLAKVNKNFHKKKFSVNTGDNSFAVKKVCQVCGMHFRSTMHYTMHMRKKGFCRPPPFDCNNCGKTFKNIHHLVNHEKRKTPCAKKNLLTPIEEEHSVIEADTEEGTKKGTKMISNKSYSSSSNLKCSKCNAQFTLFYWYNRHISHPSSCKPNGYKRNKGKVSSWKLTGKTAFTLEECKTAGGYKCKKCGHVFRFPYRLLAHLQRKVPCTIQSSKKSVLSEKSAALENSQEPNTVAAGVQLRRKLLNPEKTSNVGIKIIRKYWKMAKTQSKKQNVIKYGTLICCICDKTFFNSYTWNSHLKIHSTVGEKCLVKCPVCLSIFPSSDELHCHQQETNHWGKLMKSRINHCRCPFCDKKFAYLGSRQNHVQRHLEDYPLEAKEFLNSTTCSICDEYFASEAKKMAHIRRNHQNVKLAEKKKNANRSSEEILELVAEEAVNSKDKMKHEVTSPLPPIPSKNIVNTATVVKHKKNTKNGKLHSCSFCKKKFVWLERLIAHQQAVHSNCLIFQCSSCHQKFSSLSIINHHIKKKHRNSKEENLIIELGNPDDCRSEYLKPPTKDQESVSNANNSVLIDNSSQEVFSCAVCNISNFSKRAALLRHKKSRIHRRNLKLSFKSVNKLTSYPSKNKHVIKSFKLNCSVCSQSFKKLSSFVSHRLSHFNFENPDIIEISESNPYCCEICSMLIHHHQKVQSHLTSHLQQGKAKSLKHKKIVDLNQESGTKEGLMELPRNNHDMTNDLKQENKADSQSMEVQQTEKISKPIRKVNFSCKLCNEGFRTRRLWNLHVRYRCRLKRICKHCKQCFPSRKLFLVHQAQAACEELHKKLHCQYCSLDFSSANDLGWHEKSCQKVHGTERGEFNINNMNNLFHCQYCQAPFLSLETCQEHEKRFCKCTCTICKAHFTSCELLNEHMNEFHDTKQSTSCSICGIYLKSIKALHVHLKTHEHRIDEKIKNCKNKGRKSKPNKTSACPHCDKTYQGHRSLKEHLVIHNPFKCPICGEIENDIRGFRKHPCKLPNGTFATGIKYRKKWSRSKIAQMREECCMSLLAEHGHDDSFEKIKELPKQVEVEKDVKPTCKNATFQQTPLENSDKNGLEEKVTLTELRTNFSQLLYLFVADPELMSELGYGKKPIDEVLTVVLQNMGQSSIIVDATCSELERLRENIRLLLRVCIKDQVMDAVDGENKLVDDIVVDMLGMCKETLGNQIADIIS